MVGKSERTSCLATIFIWPTKYVAHNSIYELKFQCLDFFQAPHKLFSRTFSLSGESYQSTHIFLQAETQLNCSVMLLHIYCIAPKTQWKIRIPLLNEDQWLLHRLWLCKRIQTKKPSPNDCNNKRSPTLCPSRRCSTLSNTSA